MSQKRVGKCQRRIRGPHRQGQKRARDLDLPVPGERTFAKLHARGFGKAPRMTQQKARKERRAGLTKRARQVTQKPGIGAQRHQLGQPRSLRAFRKLIGQRIDWRGPSMAAELLRHRQVTARDKRLLQRDGGLGIATAQRHQLFRQSAHQSRRIGEPRQHLRAIATAQAALEHQAPHERLVLPQLVEQALGLGILSRHHPQRHHRPDPLVMHLLGELFDKARSLAQLDSWQLGHRSAPPLGCGHFILWSREFGPSRRPPTWDRLRFR